MTRDEAIADVVKEALAEGKARWTGGEHITDADIQQFREMPSVAYLAGRVSAALTAAEPFFAALAPNEPNPSNMDTTEQFGNPWNIIR